MVRKYIFPNFELWIQGVSKLSSLVFTDFVYLSHRYIVSIKTLQSGSMHNYPFRQYEKIQLGNWCQSSWNCNWLATSTYKLASDTQLRKVVPWRMLNLLLFRFYEHGCGQENRTRVVYCNMSKFVSKIFWANDAYFCLTSIGGVLQDLGSILFQQFGDV